MSSRCRTDCRRGDPRRRPNGGIAAMIAVTLALGLGVAAAGPANAAQGKVAGGPSHCPPGLAKKGCVPPGHSTALPANDVIWGFNFLPETAMEQQLGLRQVLQSRIAEIHETIGEDAAILDEGENVNEKSMYCIYEKKSDQLSFLEDEDDDFVDISEAEELLRSLSAEDPEEFTRIANLRDGIRTARATLAGDEGKNFHSGSNLHCLWI